MTEKKNIQVLVAGPEHEIYVDTILQTIADAAKVRGTGIAKRTHEYLATKMKEAKAVIALCDDRFAGFSYIEAMGQQAIRDHQWTDCPSRFPWTGCSKENQGHDLLPCPYALAPC